MDQNVLQLPGNMYLWAKMTQGVYQLSYVFYLLGKNKEDAKVFTVLSIVILALILCLYYSMYKNGVAFFNQNTKISEYTIIIILDVVTAIIALIGYPTAISLIKLEYEDEKEKLYYNHHCKYSGLKENKLSRAPRYLDEETINEQIESTTNYLLDQAINLRNNVISFVGINENLSEQTDLSINEYNVTMNLTSVQDTSQMYEDFYYSYINLQLLITSVISLILQVFVTAVLGWIEFIKYKIRKSNQGEAYEMGAWVNAVSGGN